MTPSNEAFLLPVLSFFAVLPPTHEQKETAGRKEKAEPPDSELGGRTRYSVAFLHGAIYGVLRSEVGLVIFER